jgi:hypothetical protein
MTEDRSTAAIPLPPEALYAACEVGASLMVLGADRVGDGGFGSIALWGTRYAPHARWQRSACGATSRAVALSSYCATLIEILATGLRQS